MANTESNPEVLGQLASTAKRLPSDVALQIVEGLIAQPGIELDPDNGLLLWWAIESKVETEAVSIVALFQDPENWRYPVVQDFILERLASRLVLPNKNIYMDQCARLLKLAPELSLGKSAFNGTQEGLLGRSLTTVPSSLIEALTPYLEKFGEAPLSIGVRQEHAEAIDSALKIISHASPEVKEQLAYIALFGELQIQQSIESLLQLMENNSARTSLRHAALKSLENFDQAQIGKRVADAYPDKLRAEPSLKQAALDLLVSRNSWANHLIHLIDTTKQVKSDDLPTEVIHKMQLLNDQQLTIAINKIWPQFKIQSSQEKEQIMQRVKSVVPSGSIDLSSGKSIYTRLCGACHQLFGQGGSLGPDLTGYDRKNLNYLILNIVDPNIDIREGYVNYKLVTTNDRILSGVLTQRSDQMVTIRSFAGDQTSIPAAQIKELQAQTISLMPERLIDDLTDQEIVDLFGYIMNE
jgi:putative heme-binding domain-containing protein